MVKELLVNSRRSTTTSTATRTTNPKGLPVAVTSVPRWELPFRYLAQNVVKPFGSLWSKNFALVQHRTPEWFCQLKKVLRGKIHYGTCHISSMKARLT